MPDELEYWNYRFKELITEEGKSAETLFFQEAFDGGKRPYLRKTFGGLIASATMARSGFFLCEKRDPLAYFEFLMCVASRLGEEMRRLPLLSEPYVATEADAQACPYHYLANVLLDNGVYKAVRPIAWALISGGLRLCRRVEDDAYPGLILGLCSFINTELERTKGWPRTAEWQRPGNRSFDHDNSKILTHGTPSALDDQYWEARFEAFIHGNDQCPESLFSDHILAGLSKKFLDTPNNPQLIGSSMAMAGLYFCERFSPSNYFYFLQCAGHRIRGEYHLHVGNADVPRVALSRQQRRLFGISDFADNIYCDDRVKCARAVAWGLIRDGLKVCQKLEPECYPSLVASLYDRIFDFELKRAESWNRFE